VKNKRFKGSIGMRHKEGNISVLMFVVLVKRDEKIGRYFHEGVTRNGIE